MKQEEKEESGRFWKPRGKRVSREDSRHIVSEIVAKSNKIFNDWL